MIEIIDINSKKKMIGMVIASIKYMSDNYIIYAVDRGNGEANLFVSKLVKMSEGFTFKNDFLNGEKSFAVKELSKLYKYEYTTIAFGDQLNDIPMIKEAKIGVAMINGKDKVKEEADYITEFDCDNEGVRLFLENIIK